MAKLYFRYGAMNSGKSTALLQVAHNYEERGMNVFLIKPALDSKADDNISSRLGMNRKVDKLVNSQDNLIEIVEDRLYDGKIACILVDEVQFLDPEQIDELFEIAVKMKIPVIAYGLRTDFKMEGFPASQRLLLIAHSIEELKTICRCGKKAILNGRKLNDKFVFEGEQVAIDEVSNVTYESLCANCYFKMKDKSKKKNKSISSFLDSSFKSLKNSSKTPMFDAKLILKKVLGISETKLVTNSDYVLTEDEQQQCNELIERRINKEPIAYITGQKGFMNYEFNVGEGVLIPRPDTEILVERTSKIIGSEEMLGLEIGVGSGCISISLLKLCDNLRMRASDISKIAIKYAKENAEKLMVSDRIDIFEADLVDDWESQDEYDFIVSNPPYIDEFEFENLMVDVKDYEAKTALYGGKDGLDFYRRILDLSKYKLKNGGFIAFEIGFDQKEKVRDLFIEHKFNNIKVYQDLGGRDRVVIGVKNDK